MALPPLSSAQIWGKEAVPALARSGACGWNVMARDSRSSLPPSTWWTRNNSLHGRSGGDKLNDPSPHVLVDSCHSHVGKRRQSLQTRLVTNMPFRQGWQKHETPPPTPTPNRRRTRNAATRGGFPRSALPASGASIPPRRRDLLVAVSSCMAVSSCEPAGSSPRWKP